MSSISATGPLENPWPCSQCGDVILLQDSTGRIPLQTKFATGLLASLIIIAFFRWPAVEADQFFGVIAALLGLCGWSLYRNRAQAWHCTTCGFKEPPRLTPTGIPQPLIVVPTYNNESTIGSVVERVRNTCPDTPFIVVNDGSTDQTAAMAQHAANSATASAPFELLQHKTNKGKGRAIQTALQHGFSQGFSHIITLDGDGQHFPEDLPKMLDALNTNPNAIWVGERDLTGSNVQESSRFGRAFSNFWLKVQTGVTLSDSQTGFRAYPTATVLSLGTRSKFYDFEVEVLTLGARAGIPLKSITIGVYYPPITDRISHFDKLWDNIRISWVNTRLLAGVFLWPLGWPARFKKGTPPAGRKRRWSGQSRGGKFGHLFFIYLLKLAGPRLAHLAVYPVAFYFMLAAPKAVRASKEYLDRIVGTEQNVWRRFWRSYQHILNFAQNILDRSATLALGTDFLDFTEDGIETIASAKEGSIILSAHLGNYEIAGSCFHYRELPVAVVMLDSEAENVRQVYAHLKAQSKLPKVISINQDEMPAIKILRALREGYAVGLHGDRIIDDNWVECDFLGGKARIATGAFIMAAAAKVPIILAFGFRLGFNRYHFVGRGPHTITLPRKNRKRALQRYAQWYADQLEAVARAYPYHWFNFFDFWENPEDTQDEQGNS